MSLAVAFKGPEGIVLAADSRVTVMLTANPAMGAPITGTPMLMPQYFDHARKLLTVSSQPFVGVVIYGAGAIGQQAPRTAHSYIPEFEAHLTDVCTNGEVERLSVERVAEELRIFFLSQWNAAGMPNPSPDDSQQMVFIVAGFDEGAAYGSVYQGQIPNSVTPIEQNANDFGVTYGGQTELVQRLLGGFDLRALSVVKDHLQLDDAAVISLQQELSKSLGLAIPCQLLPLQDCVDLSEFMVSMTTVLLTWMLGVRGVGGQVDVAAITRTEGLRHIRQKEIKLWD